MTNAEIKKAIKDATAELRNWWIELSLNHGDGCGSDCIYNNVTVWYGKEVKDYSGDMLWDHEYDSREQDNNSTVAELNKSREKLYKYLVNQFGEHRVAKTEVSV